LDGGSPLPDPTDLAPTPENVARALAIRMAASIGDPVSDVVKRKKSQSWMIGQLRKAFPGHPDEQLRAAIDGLRRQKWTREDAETTRDLDRPPTRYHEPKSWPCWTERAERLGDNIPHPLTAGELISRTGLILRWGRNLTIQSLAFAEELGELWYDGTFWRRTRERIIMVDVKKQVKVKRVTRKLAVALDPTQRAALVDKMTNIRTEKAALEAELVELQATMRTRIRERQAALERTLESLSTGVSVEDVTCEERISYEDGTVTVVRKDTGALVDKREMTAEERQLSLEATGS
jgi:hypothetical protein